MNEGKGIYGGLIDIKTDRQTEDKRRWDDRDKERHKQGSYHIFNKI